MTWYTPRLLMKPNINVGRPTAFSKTSIYVNNYYGNNGSGGLWNSYYSRMSAQNAGTPVTMDPRYYCSNYNYGYPSWVERAIDNSYLFSFLQGMIGGGGGCNCP